MKGILLVEDDVTFSEMLKQFLIRHKYAIDVSYNLKSALQQLEKKNYDLVFTDLRLPDGDGITLLKKIKLSKQTIPVVLMTSYAQVSTAVQAMKQGAFDYISKPFNPSEVLEVINNALEEKTSKLEKSQEKEEEKPTIEEKSTTTTGFVKGISNASKNLDEYICLVAPINMSVLITGESGTGKEVVAKTIHLKSPRNNKPFIAVDCGAIPREIASSEFFGHIKGSFTGALNNKEGHFSTANGGTLFLDEIGNLSYELQVQLLRAIQERKIRPIGSNQEVEVDIRIIAATNSNLELEAENGNFREDLLHRLNESSVQVPSLKERAEDLMIFADYFIEKANT